MIENLSNTISRRYRSTLKSLFPGESPYMFAGNNPIFYVDEDGKWKVLFRDYNDHSAGIVLVAEPGDNLQTLAVQLGIPYKEFDEAPALQKNTNIFDVEFNTEVVYVVDFKHLDPHFISYYVKLIIDN